MYSKQTESMLTRDGVRLDADVYRPAAEGEFPVLLMRQPYGRAIASTVVYAHPVWYAAQGYIVVIQDVRGRGTSAGEFKLFESEIEDGYDAVQWAASLPGSTGSVGMYGFSYQGMTQLYAAAAQPAALKTICPAMIAYDLYTDWAYENGAFCWQTNLAWAIQLAAETARRQGDESAHQALVTAAKNPPLHEVVPTRSSLLETLDPNSFYHEWLEHSQPDDYWRNLSPKTHLQDIDLPMLHIGGWFDTFLRGTLGLYKAMAARSQQRQQLVVGPWAHLPWGRNVGAKDFGAAAVSPCDRLQILWFDHFLKGKDTGLLDEPPIQLFEMGTNTWQHLNAWDFRSSVCFDLASTGLAAIDPSDGKLIPQPSSSDSLTPDVLVHDPWRPVPACGGHASFPAGPQERNAIDDRPDVLTYTSAPLKQDLHLVGEITVNLHCSADQESFDLCAVLSEVQPDGSIYNFTQGYTRVSTKTNPLQIPLQPTCMRLKQGNALRLSLSGACFPAYPTNAGTGQTAAASRLIDHQIATIAITSNSDFPSTVALSTHSMSL